MWTKAFSSKFLRQTSLIQMVTLLTWTFYTIMSLKMPSLIYRIQPINYLALTRISKSCGTGTLWRYPCLFNNLIFSLSISSVIAQPKHLLIISLSCSWTIKKFGLTTLWASQIRLLDITRGPASGSSFPRIYAMTQKEALLSSSAKYLIPT